jgi:hypothetical protein
VIGSYTKLVTVSNGALPSWLANAAVVEQPFETMKTIRQHMINEKYVNAQLSFIREPNR